MKKVWKFTLKQIYLKDIISGAKTVEWRTWRIFQQIKAWDEIIFFNKFAEVKKTIKEVKCYSNIDDYLQNELESSLPWIKSIEQWKKLYLAIPWYVQKIRQYWIIAIKF